MEILKDLKEFEEYCLKNNDLNAELVYNAQETIQVLIEDRARLIAAAEAYIEGVELDRFSSNAWVAEQKTRLQQTIKEAKGDE